MNKAKEKINQEVRNQAVAHRQFRTCASWQAELVKIQEYLEVTAHFGIALHRAQSKRLIERFEAVILHHTESLERMNIQDDKAAQCPVCGVQSAHSVCVFARGLPKDLYDNM